MKKILLTSLLFLMVSYPLIAKKTYVRHVMFYGDVHDGWWYDAENYQGNYLHYQKGHKEICQDTPGNLRVLCDEEIEE